MEQLYTSAAATASTVYVLVSNKIRKISLKLAAIVQHQRKAMRANTLLLHHTTTTVLTQFLETDLCNSKSSSHRTTARSIKELPIWTMDGWDILVCPTPLGTCHHDPWMQQNRVSKALGKRHYSPLVMDMLQHFTWQLYQCCVLGDSDWAGCHVKTCKLLATTGNEVYQWTVLDGQ